jgi:hypothetical protein
MLVINGIFVTVDFAPQDTESFVWILTVCPEGLDSLDCYSGRIAPGTHGTCSRAKMVGGHVYADRIRMAASNPKEACSQRHATLGMEDLAQAFGPMYKTSVKAGVSYGAGHHETRNSCI